MCYNSRAYDDYCLDQYEPPRDEELIQLEKKMDDVRDTVKILLNILYSKEPINESDLLLSIDYLSEKLEIQVPLADIQIARKSQALMDLQRYLLAIGK